VPRAVSASNANHRVPEHARAETARTLAATPGIRGEPTDAERGRTLLAASHTAALATVALDGGFPFGSLVAYAVDGAGRPLLCLSDLAEHSRNLAADPRASLMVSASGDGDPLALARVTVLGTVVELRDDDRSAALDAYRERHPDAFYAAFDDFRLYRLDVASVRYVGGFGRMSWVSADDHAAAEPDPLHPHAAGIVEHMNDDHADALVAYCRVFGDRPATGDAEMVGVDRYGFTMLAVDEGATDRVAVRIAFGRQVDTVGAVRAAMIKLLHEARDATGPSEG
jgi:heme oxygenase (biliverdin-IX-beta and delta-forming)